MPLRFFFLFLFVVFFCSCQEAITESIDDSKSEMLHFEIHGQQFQWTIRYAGSDSTLGACDYQLVTTENPLGLDQNDRYAHDDVVVTKHFYLPVYREMMIQFRSRDVIHNAYMPHQRLTMNVVPGMTTSMRTSFAETTAEARDKLSAQPDSTGVSASDFDFQLVCSKVCGAGHSNMSATVTVVSNDEFEQWLSEQPTVAEQLQW